MRSSGNSLSAKNRGGRSASLELATRPRTFLPGVEAGMSHGVHLGAIGSVRIKYRRVFEMRRFLVHVGAVVLLLCGTRPVAAGPIQVEMTTTNGTVPGTSITYTIDISGDDGGPRNMFNSATSDNGVWQWQGPNPNFPEFLSFGEAETLTVTFSAPLPLSHLVLGVNSTSASTSTLSVSGGTGTTSSFNLSDSLQIYTGPTGGGHLRRCNGIPSPRFSVNVAC